MAGATIERAAHPGAVILSRYAVFPDSGSRIDGVDAAMEGAINAASQEASN